jgi:hypothetical protein
MSSASLVGKVVAEEHEDVEREVAIGVKIMALSTLSSKYFAVPTEECEPILSLQDTNAQDCSIIRKALKKANDRGTPTRLSMMLMPMAGEIFNKWVSNIDKSYGLYEKTFVHLLEGMVLYQRAGYIHNDIHGANILVDSQNVARYIDFGRSFHIKEVRSLDTVHLGKSFAPSYTMYSPELHLIEALMDGISPEHGIVSLVHAQYTYYDALAHHFLRPDVRTMRNWKPLLTLFHTMDDTDINMKTKRILEFVRTYAKLFDSWRIGILMWVPWYDFLRHGKVMNPVLRGVLDGLTKFDVRDRWTAEKALGVLSPSNPILAQV